MIIISKIVRIYFLHGKFSLQQKNLIILKLLILNILFIFMLIIKLIIILKKINDRSLSHP